MADNILVDGGDNPDFTVASDKISGVDWQYVKIAWGSDGVATIVDAANPIPVTVISAPTTAVTVSGAVDTELTTTDMDSGAGTATRAVMGLIVPASGGPVVVPGDATNGLKVQATVTPAASRSTDSVAAALSVDRLMNNLTAVAPGFAVIDHATNGDNTIVAAQGASNMILVHQLVLVAAGTVNVRFESAASGTALTGQMQLTAQTGVVLPFSPIGWFRTVANQLLNMELSAAVSVDGVLAYTVVT